MYLDTSAAVKLIVAEPESEPLALFLDRLLDAADAGLVSSMLLETELRRSAQRLEVPQSSVSEVLARVDLVEPGRAVFHDAGLLPGPPLRSLDALHLATAVIVDAEPLVAYGARLIEAAQRLGLATISPR